MNARQRAQIIPGTFSHTRLQVHCFQCVLCSSLKTVLYTRRHPAPPLSALIRHHRKIKALWSQNYNTGVYVVPGRERYSTMPSTREYTYRRNFGKFLDPAKDERDSVSPEK